MMHKTILTTIIMAMCGVTAQAKHNRGNIDNVEDLTLSAPQQAPTAGGTINSVPKASRGLTVQGTGSSIGSIASTTRNIPTGKLDAGAAINEIGKGGGGYYKRGSKQDLAKTNAEDNCPGGYLNVPNSPRDPITVTAGNGTSFQATRLYNPSILEQGNFTNTKYPGISAREVFKNTGGFLLLKAVGRKPTMTGLGFKLADYYLSDATMKGRIASNGLGAQMDQVWVRAVKSSDGQINWCAVGGGGGGGGQQGTPGAAGQGAAVAGAN